MSTGNSNAAPSPAPLGQAAARAFSFRHSVGFFRGIDFCVWALALPSQPSAAQIMARFCVSRRTAYEYREAWFASLASERFHCPGGE